MAVSRAVAEVVSRAVAEAVSRAVAVVVSRAVPEVVSRAVVEAVSRAIYSGTVCSIFFLSPYFSSLLFGTGKRIDYTTLSFSPSEIKKRNVAFLHGLIAEHRILTLNGVITGATN